MYLCWILPIDRRLATRPSSPIRPSPSTSTHRPNESARGESNLPEICSYTGLKCSRIPSNLLPVVREEGMQRLPVFVHMPFISCWRNPCQPYEKRQRSSTKQVSAYGAYTPAESHRVGHLSKLQETTDILRGLCTPDIPATLPVESGLPVRF